MKTLGEMESADGFSWRLALEWKVEDCWVGVFWKRAEILVWPMRQASEVSIWICLLPCLPIHITLRRLA